MIGPLIDTILAATSGLGLAAAEGFARLGARVRLLARERLTGWHGVPLPAPAPAHAEETG